VKPTLVDSNILLDLATKDPNWSEWSAAALERAGDEGVIAVNPIVYAEVSVYASSMEELNQSLEDFEYWPLPREAGFLAGKMYGKYKTQSEHIVTTSRFPVEFVREKSFGLVTEWSGGSESNPYWGWRGLSSSSTAPTWR